MSRLSKMSPEAIKAIFSPDSDDAIITLLTFYDPDTLEVSARICNGYTKRIAETDTDVLYGVTSRGHDFVFLPVDITLPSEEDNTSPQCSFTLHDVTHYVTPLVRSLKSPPRVLMEVVMSNSPDTVEVSFDEFYVTSFNYNASTVVAELAMVDYSIEPFPCFTFSPAHFPGLF